MWCVAFSPDDQLVLGCSAHPRDSGKPGGIRAWEVTTGEEIAVMEDASKPVRSFAFSPDGQYLILGGNDGSIRLLSWTSKR